MFATHDIKEGEVVGELPYSMGFNAEGVSRASSKKGLWEELYKNTKVPDVLVTGMFLLSEIEAGNASFFAPYIDLLPPPSRMQTSLGWDASFQRLIESNRQIVGIREEALSLFERAYTQFFSVVETLPSYRRDVRNEDFPIFARQAMLWAYDVQLSRSFSWGDLMPIMDVPNHADIRNHPTKSGHLKMMYDNNGKRVLLRVEGGPVKAGEQIFGTYGHRDNSKLLAQYGFTMWPNSFHRVAILSSASGGGHTPPVPAPMVKFKEVPASGALEVILASSSSAELEAALPKRLSFTREEFTKLKVPKHVLTEDHCIAAGGKCYQVMDPWQDLSATVAACEVGAYWCEHGRLPGLSIEAWEYHRAQVLAQAQVGDEAGRGVSTWRAVYDIKSALASGERAVGRMLLELLTLRGLWRSLVRACARTDRVKAECQKQSADASLESVDWPQGHTLEGRGKRDMRPLQEMACTLAERDAAILAAATEQVHKEWMTFLRALKELACKADLGSLQRSSEGWCGEESL